MANQCYTNLLVAKAEKEEGESFGARTEQMVKWLEENYFYDGSMGDICEDEEFFEVSGDTKWNVCPEVLQDFAKKFNVRVRADGREAGVGFLQLVHVEDTGEILSDEELAFQF